MFRFSSGRSGSSDANKAQLRAQAVRCDTTSEDTQEEDEVGQRKGCTSEHDYPEI